MPIHGCICHVCISGREMNAYLVVLFRLFGQGDSMPVVHGCNLPVGFLPVHGCVSPYMFELGRGCCNSTTFQLYLCLCFFGELVVEHPSQMKKSHIYCDDLE